MSDKTPPIATEQKDLDAVIQKSYPDNTALTIAFYSAARAEVIQRITLRDTTVLAWITTSGVLLGLGVRGGNDDLGMRLWIAELLPAISLAFGLAVYRHTYIMECITDYFVNHLNTFLRQDEDISLVPRHWDNSPTIKAKIPIYLGIELFAYFLLMTGPPVGCVIYLWVHDMRLQTFWFWQACLCTILLMSLLGAKLFQTRKLIAYLKRRGHAH
jgi:hypothetical protein